MYISRDLGISSIHIRNMAPRSRSKAQPAAVQPAPVQPASVQRAPVRPAPVDDETLDLDDVSDTSDEEDAPPVPANARAAGTSDETTRVAPIIKPTVKSNRALDIDLFFDRGKGKPSVCKHCK